MSYYNIFMEKIESFKVNHDVLVPGVYVSRIDGDVVTYDIRVKVPNGGDYLSSGEAHTLEHLFATFVRNSRPGEIIYFGPMGCRTGFYLLVRDSLSPKEVLGLIKESFKFSEEFSGDVPGVSKRECGNYLDHDLEGAREISKFMRGVLENWTVEDMRYEK